MKDNDLEVWKDIPGYEGLYQASDLGRIYSLKSNIIMKGGNSHGYISMTLRKDNNIKSLKRNRLVMYAFHGIRDLYVDHVNGVKDDDRLVNLRYATPRENNHFYTLTQDRASKFIGVTYIKRDNKWRARIKIEGQEYNLGHYNEEKEASLVYNEALSSYLYDGTIPNYIRENTTSKFKGVSWCKKSNKWTAHICISNKKYRLGCFILEEEASKVYANAKLNWEKYGVLPILRSTLYSSNYKGVSFNKKLNRWTVQINKKYIGSYLTEKEAIKAVELYYD